MCEEEDLPTEVRLRLSVVDVFIKETIFATQVLSSGSHADVAKAASDLARAHINLDVLKSKFLSEKNGPAPDRKTITISLSDGSDVEFPGADDPYIFR